MKIEFEIVLDQGQHQLDVRAACDANSLGFYGASGAGKTSLLECLAGWRKAQRGFARVGQRVLFDTSTGVDLPKNQRGIGYLPQDLLLFPHWDVRGNVAAGQAPGADPALLKRLCDVLDLEPLLKRSVTELSGGEQQRVGLARALASSPSLLLLDEPLGSLDLPLRRKILPYLIRTRAEFDIPMIVVSHDPTEIKALCDEVLVLAAGKVIDQGRPSAVLSDPRRVQDPFAGVENVLNGEVTAGGEGTTPLVLNGGAELRLPASGLAPGERVLVGLRAKDILISTKRPEGISARNVLRATVVGIEPFGEDVLIATELASPRGGAGDRIHVELTSNAARELELKAGAEVHLVIKAHACRVLSGV
mgnify:CR=1 FL=1